MKGYVLVLTLVFGLTAACVRNADPPCQMQIAPLANSTEGPLALTILGSGDLCLDIDGDANLSSFTATLEITNQSNKIVELELDLGLLRSFRSREVWIDGPDEASERIPDPPIRPSDARLETRTLSPGDSTQLSSWTRHHTIIWTEAATRDPNSAPREFLVRFFATFSYASEDGPPVIIDRSFDIPFRAVPPAR